MLIFHHGGLSASHELELKKPEHCSAFLRIMLSILLWQSPADAGFPEFTDGMTWVLPSKVGTVEVKQKEVLYYHPSIRSRETFVALLEREKPPPSPTAQATPFADTASDIIWSANTKQDQDTSSGHRCVF